MNKSSMWLLGVTASVAGYWLYKRSQAANPATGLAYPQNYRPGQPSQSYPWQPTVPPRVDNANQPWYNGSKAGMVGPAESNVNSFASSLQAGSSVIHSVKDIWGDLSNIFSSPDPVRDLNAPTDILGEEYSGVAEVSSEQLPDFTDQGDFSGEYA